MEDEEEEEEDFDDDEEEEEEEGEKCCTFTSASDENSATAPNTWTGETVEKTATETEARRRSIFYPKKVGAEIPF